MAHIIFWNYADDVIILGGNINTVNKNTVFMSC